LIVVWNVDFFADPVPLLHFLQSFLACHHNCESFEEILVEGCWICAWVRIDPFTFSGWVHPFQSFEYNFSPFSAYFVLGNQKVRLKVFFSDSCIIVNRNVNSCKDEVFSQLCIDTICWGNENSEGKQSSLRKMVPFLSLNSDESLSIKPFSLFFGQEGFFTH
jgi:hypothetical protein